MEEYSDQYDAPCKTTLGEDMKEFLETNRYLSQAEGAVRLEGGPRRRGQEINGKEHER